MNTATGFQALQFNTTGSSNTAVGAFALKGNIDGEVNTAIGNFAMINNTSGIQNVASGFGSLSSNTNGSQNTAIGFHALLNNTGANNTAIGKNAGANATTGDGNVYIGADIEGVAGESNQTYIRNVSTTEQSPAEDVAFVTVRIPDGRIGHQPIVMRNAGPDFQKATEELKSTVARHETTIAQLKKAVEILTAQLKEQAAQNQK